MNTKKSRSKRVQSQTEFQYHNSLPSPLLTILWTVLFILLPRKISTI